MKRQMNERPAPRRRLAGLALGLALLLAACGGGEEESAPAEYRIGDDFLPSLTQLTLPGEDTPWTQEGEEDQPSYHYEGLESGSAAVTDYVSALVDVYKCSVLDEEDRETALGDLPEEGALRVGIAGQVEDGLFLLDIQWGATSCTVTPSFEAGAHIQPSEAESLTMSEAVMVLEERSPQALGLEGEDLSAYSVYAGDGIVMVDGQPCFQVEVYVSATHQIAGSYMVSSTGEHVYHLDRETGTVTEVGR